MSRLEKLRAAQRQNMELIMYFCLTPTWELFSSIQKPKMVSDECYSAFRAGVIYKFGEHWDTDQLDDEIENLSREFLTLDRILSDSIKRPTRTKCEQLMYVFYGTGELKYIDLFYQCMGIVSSVEVRRTLSSLWKLTEDKYLERISELLAKDPNHFEKYDVNLSDVNFSHFSKESIEKYRQIANDVKFHKKILDTDQKV